MPQNMLKKSQKLHGDVSGFVVSDKIANFGVGFCVRQEFV